jgi:hypothetical protein
METTIKHCTMIEFDESGKEISRRPMATYIPPEGVGASIEAFCAWLDSLPKEATE